jgi:hypothetical protein
MAKEQNLSLNPTKISGACGRLMCCLKHEQDTYEYLNSKLPNVGDRVTAYDGVTGEVASLNVLRQKVKIYVTDEEGNKELVEYRVEELVSGPRGRRFETDESLLDPELSQLEDDGEPGEEGRSAGGRHRRNRPENADGGQGRGARERSGREHGGRDRKEGGAKDRTEQRPERDGEKKERNRNNRDHSDRNRNRDGGRREGGREGNRDMNREGGRDGNRDMNRDGGRDGNREMNREGNRRGGDQNQAQNQQGQSKEQGGGQRSRRRHNRPNRKPEDKSQQ